MGATDLPEDGSESDVSIDDDIDIELYHQLLIDQFLSKTPALESIALEIVPRTWLQSISHPWHKVELFEEVASCRFRTGRIPAG